MKHAASVYGLCIFLAGACFGQQARPKYDPGTAKEARESKRSFVDFTLDRLNRADKDYGQCFEESRRFLVDETIKNSYFWSNLMSLGLASCLLIVVVYQHRQMLQREWDMSEVLQQYEHALSRANAQVDAATARNQGFIEATLADRERISSLPFCSTERKQSDASTALKPGKNVSAVTVELRPVGTVTVTNKANGTVPDLGDQMGLFKPDVDLILKVNALEQQLQRSQEQQKQLRRQLTQADQRLQNEQQKNRNLKGA